MEGLTIYLPSTLENFTGELPEIPQGSIGTYKIIIKMSLVLINGELKELLRNFDRDNQWIIEYDMTDEEKQVLNDFKSINYDQSSNSIGIINYYGNDSAIYVPTAIIGIPVTSFSLGNDDDPNISDEQSISNIKEIHLPSTLKNFSISHYLGYNEIYHIDKIYYDGSYDDFEKICYRISDLTVKYTAKDIEDFYNKMLLVNPEMLANYAIKQIILYDDKITIKLNNPIKRSPDDSDDTNSQGFLFAQKYAKLQSVKISILMYI